MRDVESTNVERLYALQVEADTLAASGDFVSPLAGRQQDELLALRPAVEKALERLDRQLDVI